MACRRPFVPKHGELTDPSRMPKLAESLAVVRVLTLFAYRFDAEVTRIASVKGKAALVQILRSYL